MAYQTNQRDPLLDSAMQAAIEKRGRELVGLLLLGLAVCTGALLVSYVPDDPSFFSATDAPAENWLGRFGASVAAPLFIIVGFAAWTIVAVVAVWGLRLMLNIGAERVLARAIFLPLVVFVASIYAATLVPGADWTQSFGLGGLLGDTVLGALINILPIRAAEGVRLLALPIGLLGIVLFLFSAGFSRLELRKGVRFVLYGLVMLYAGLVGLLGMGARQTRDAAAGLSARQAARREARQDVAEVRADAPIVVRDAAEEPPLTKPAPAAPPKAGLLASVTKAVRRAPEPEPEASIDAEQDGGDDRVQTRIANAIRARALTGQDVRPAPVGRTEPPVRRARKPEPLIVKVPGAVPTAPMAQLDAEAPAPARFVPPAAPDVAESPPAQSTSRIAPRLGAATEHTSEPAAPVDLAQEEPSSPARDSSPSERLPMPEEAPSAVVQHPPRRAAQPSRRAVAEAQPSLALEPHEDGYETPPLSLLTSPERIVRHILPDDALEENARMLESVLDDYGVKGEIVSVRPGPVVTMYELEPAPGLKASRVIGLADDIARSMSALSARVSTVPGRSVIGIELPNANREKVLLRELLSVRDYEDQNVRLPLALGKDIGGAPVVANLAKMPHLLIAGTTGSGKSVAINTMILSLLYRLTPDECRLIMIDPKMLELSVYDGIPHLLSPVVTDPKKAVVALKWVVAEMEDRYRKMSKMGVRNIEGYNGRVRETLAKGEMFSRTVQTGFDDETGEPVFETEEFAPETLPYIVVVVDEMADLMMVAGKEIEACIQRLAQMARASGIHLIMATQRPSVDVITGTIKANFPTRISFQVTSKVDSRTILGEMGAEQLLGMGDMLHMAGGGRITRVHGPFVSDEEVEEVVNHLKAFGPPDYVGGVQDGPDEERESDIDAVLGLATGGNTDGEDALYDQAVAIVARDRKCSTSYIQRKLAIGYNKAARLVEQMEDNGVVGPSNSVGKREILVPEP
ncbi:MAG: DNA translocase FtsK 4TM domain-containing protein [Pseudomonadota bacterium]